ncbi:hypothetical protein ACN47E_009636 [Coniothyrium glycines]
MAGSKATNTKSSSFDPSMMITVRVGPPLNTKDFMAHESFLSARSLFFRRAMNGNWSESEARLVQLPHDLPQTFELYLHHVYTGTIPSHGLAEKDTIELPKDDFQSAMEEEYRRLIAVYLLAEKFQDDLAKHTIIQTVFDVAMRRNREGCMIVPPPTCISDTYTQTPETSPARRLMVDLWACMCPETLGRNVHDLPKEFLEDLVVAVRMHDRRGNIARRKGVTHYLESPAASKPRRK